MGVQMELADAKLLVCRLTLFDQQSEVWKKQLFNKATSKGKSPGGYLNMLPWQAYELGVILLIPLITSPYAGEAFKSSYNGVSGFGGYFVANLFHVHLVYVL
jgi:hypothetical protein